LFIPAALPALAQLSQQHVDNPGQTASDPAAGSQAQVPAQSAAPVLFHGVPWRDPNTAQPGPGFSAPAGAHLSYFNGPIISNVQVVQVLYGSGSYNSQVAGTTMPSMGQFYGDILGSNSGLISLLTQYNTNISGGTNQIFGFGTFAGLFQIVPAAGNNGSTITDVQIQSELLSQITAGHLPAPTNDAAGNPNTLYMIFFPPGKTISQGGSNSCQAGGFCAYHGTTSSLFGGKHVLYGVMPDMQAGSGCATGCGGSTTFGNYTSVTSHELVEAMTDAFIGIATTFGPPLAWYDRTNNGEIGDLCNAQQGSYNANGTPYTIQLEFSNAANDCVLPPGFSLAASPSSLTVVQGSSGSSTIAVTPTGGFTGAVTLSNSALPSGVTASYSTNPATSTSSVTFTASSTATTGTSTITITGTSGALIRTTTINLTINVPPNFTLAASPTSLTVVQGSNGSSTLTVTPSGGFTGAVTLSNSALPSGVTATISPNPTTSSSTITFTASSAATTGTSTITITGTSGALTHTTTISLTINVPPDFTLAASPSSLTVLQGSNGSSTLTVTPSGGFAGAVTLSNSALPSGVTATISPNPTTSSSTITFTASSAATTGTSTITITGTSGALTHTTTISLTINVPPDFTLAASPSSLTVLQGSNGSSTLTVTPSGGFAGAVTLSNSALPSGVTASYSTNPATSTSSVTFTASSTATTGTSTITITGTSGALTRTTTINLTINVPPDFTLTASPSSVTVAQGSSGSSTITVTPTGGFAGAVTLSNSALPSGVTASYSTNPATSTSSVTFTASSAAATGTSAITITGTSGTLTHTTTINLTINVPPDFSLAASPSSLTVAQGSNSSSTITVTPSGGFSGAVTLSNSALPSGVTASYSTNPATSTSSVTFTASSTAATGTSTITITGTSGALTHTTTISLTINVPPDFTLAASPSSLTVLQGSNGSSTLTVTPTGGFTGAVTLSNSALPSGVTASYSTNPATSTSSVTFAASSTAAIGTSTITITGTSGALTHTTTINLTINVPPDFTLAASPTSLTVAQGSSGSSTITVTPTGSFAGAVTLSNSALPSGVTATISPNPTTSSSTITFTASSTAATGTSTITITGTSGTLTHTTTINLTINVPPDFTLTASPSSVTVAQGSSGSSTLTVTPSGGFTGAVTLSNSALPSGVTASYSTNPATSTSSVTFTASSAAATGTSTITITGTSGTLTHPTAISLTVLGPIRITKAFGAASIPLNGSTSLSFTLTNPSATAQTGVAFSDTLPAGLVISIPNGLTGSCGAGTITATQGTNTISLSGGTIAASSSCTFSVNVTGIAAGLQTNTTGNVTSTEGGTSGTATASVTVEAPPSIAKVFNPSNIALNTTTSLTFTITNRAANVDPLTGVAFTDTLPTGLTVANATSTVCGGTLTTTAPTGIALTGATIAVNSQCQFSVTVTGAASGQYTNTTGNVTSTNGGTGNTATANLTVATPASITTAFGAASIPLNGITSLTFSISNPNTNLALTGVAFTDNLPAGLVISIPNGLTGSCGAGTITATQGTNTISLSGGTIAASSSCTFSVNVKGTAAGVKNNSVQVTSTEGGTGNTSNASVTVVGPPTIAKAFGAASIPLNGSTTLSFTLTNPNTTAQTGVAFSDTLPAGLVISTPNGLTGSCGAGTITAIQGRTRSA
jgi:hypothetical protein